MVNNHIKVYARIKKETVGHHARYDVITDEDDYQTMKIYNSGNSFKRKRRTFRFNKVFAPDSTQEDIFNIIAEPIIHEVFDGLNATIFAYGATGSGKTYTLTGSQNKYTERGLIPRTIEYIFKLVTDNMSNYMFFISYLEIYNENAYDLLNPKQNFSCLEELPRVIVLEDEKGEAHFKNLCLKEVNTEKEAMRLLYSGDNNRTIAETPLNDYSSRSHCVFTVHVISKCHTSGNITRSKLNLVDLAGSERLHRMNLHGMTLNEARHINLSLHYLERVIQALSHKGKNHVPYRNSMMTFILRDSLGGNCLTAMLATLSMLNLNIEETISTCKFAQRVCLIKLNANVNFVATPEKEIHFLRNELKRLRRQLGEKNNVNRKLTREEENECKLAVGQFLRGKDDLIKLNDCRKVKYYIECLRDKLIKQSVLSQHNRCEPVNGSVNSLKEIEKKYQHLLDQKNEEIHLLMNVYETRLDTKTLFKPISNDSFLSGNRMDELEKKEFKKYLNKSQLKSHYDTCIKQIKVRYHEAVKISQSLTDKQKQIEFVKRTMAKNSVPNEDLRMRLKLDQSFYREQLLRMQNIKGDIEVLKHDMNKIKVKIMDDYKAWCFSSGNHLFPNVDGNELSLRLETKNNHNNVPRGDFQVSSCTSISSDDNPRDLPLPRIAGDLFRKKDKSSTIKKVIYNYRFRESGTQLPELELKTLPAIVIKDDISERTRFGSPHHHQQTYSLPSTKGNDLNTPRSFRTRPATPRTGFYYSNHKHKHLAPTTEIRYKIPTRCSSVVLGSSPCKSTGCVDNSENHTEQCKIEPETQSVLSCVRNRSPQFSLMQCKSADCICNYKIVEKCTDIKQHKKPVTEGCYFKYIQPDDSPDFAAYLKSVPLTGDEDVDEEIIKFYRLKYKRREIKSLVRK